MKVNDLFVHEGTIYRLLGFNDDRVLIINCFEKKMPYWMNVGFLDESESIDENELLIKTNISLTSYDDISNESKKVMYEKYGTISMILPYVTNDVERNVVINICSEKYNLSKATIRNRLCDYLIYQDIRIFSLTQKRSDKELTDDEKNFRWALNKYYYNALRLSLKETYRRMLKDKYCSDSGKLLPEVPTFRQFSYFYYKTVNKQNMIISRNGRGDFLRNHRAMLGNGIRDYCPTIGYGMFDSTVCDIFLVNDNGELLGRPILAACVDGYSSMCLGYYLGFSGGIQSLTKLICNICTDKQDYCKSFGIDISNDDWNCTQLPHKFITDKGKEYVSEAFSQIIDLGVEIINLPPYRPDLKSAVEKFFDIVQGYYKKELATKGVIFEDYQERGAVDYRKNATFTLKEFERILLLCIIKYNTKRIIDLPYELVDQTLPFSSSVWNHCLQKQKDNLISATKEEVKLTLLPRTIGKFKRNGLIVNGLRYKNFNYIEKCLSGASGVVAFDSNDVSKVWLIENGEYVEFNIIEEFFKDMDLENVKILQQKKKLKEKQVEEVVLQAKIDLSRELENIAKTHKSSNPKLEDIIKNRNIEILKGEYNE